MHSWGWGSWGWGSRFSVGGFLASAFAIVVPNDVMAWTSTLIAAAFAVTSAALLIYNRVEEQRRAEYRAWRALTDERIDSVARSRDEIAGHLGDVEAKVSEIDNKVAKVMSHDGE